MPPLIPVSSSNNDGNERNNNIRTNPKSAAKAFSPKVNRPIVVRELGPDDVLLGRGTGPNEYEGNVRFRALIRDIIETSDVQDSEDSKAKTKLATKIVETVKSRNGRFLQRAAGSRSRSTRGYTFIVAPDRVALDKTKQSLRHQLRMMDPNFKENRDKKLKLKKLREKMMHEQSPSGQVPTARHSWDGSQSNPLQNVVVATNPSSSGSLDPLLGLLAQRSQANAMSQSDAIRQLLNLVPNAASAPAPAPVAASPVADSQDVLTSALSKILASVSAAPTGRPNIINLDPAPPRPQPTAEQQQQQQLMDMLSRLSPDLARLAASNLSAPAPAPTAPAPAPLAFDQTMLLQLLGGQTAPVVQQQQSPVDRLMDVLRQQSHAPPQPSSSLESTLLNLLLR